MKSLTIINQPLSTHLFDFWTQLPLGYQIVFACILFFSVFLMTMILMIPFNLFQQQKKQQMASFVRTFALEKLGLLLAMEPKKSDDLVSPLRKQVLSELTQTLSAGHAGRKFVRQELVRLALSLEKQDRERISTLYRELNLLGDLDTDLKSNRTEKLMLALRECFILQIGSRAEAVRALVRHRNDMVSGEAGVTLATSSACLLPFSR